MYLVDRKLETLVLMTRLESGVSMEPEEAKVIESTKVRRKGQEVVLEMMLKNGKLLARQVWRSGTREVRANLKMLLVVVEDLSEEVGVPISQLIIGLTTKEEEKEGRETRGAGPNPEPGDPRKWDQQRKFQRLPSIELQELTSPMLWTTPTGQDLTWKMILVHRLLT